MAVGALVGGVLGAMVVFARLIRADSGVALAVAVLASAAAIGMLAAFAMLLGQLGCGVRWVLASGLVSLALAQYFWGFAANPWKGLTVAVFADPSEAPVLLPNSLFTLVCALLLAAVAPRAAALLQWQMLREQAVRWDAVHVTAAAGDPKAALDRLGSPVRVGRSWRLRSARTLTIAILRRDLLGILRTPARSFLSCVGIGVAMWLWYVAIGETQISREIDPLSVSISGGVALLVASLSLQSWCRGLAAAAAGVGSPQFLPVSPRALLLRHLLAPWALSSVVSFLGAVMLIALYGLDAAAFWRMTVSQAFLLACGLALRVTASLKGPLPVRLLAPSSTPVGDFSAITVALWMADGFVLSLLTGALLALLWMAAVGSLGALISAVLVSFAVLAGLLWWANTRLRG